MRPPDALPGLARAYRLVPFALGVALAAAVLYRYPPSEYTFYPQCPIWTLLQVQCPGCGTTRALAALLHGHVAEALRWNALTACALPVLLIYGAALQICRLGGWPARALKPSRTFRFASLALAAAFTVARNLQAI